MNRIVYKITNRTNGKVYIGQTNNLKRRIQEHKHDKRQNHPIHLAIKKYGFENFEVEVLYEGPDFNKKEEEYIKLFNSTNPEYGYNVLPGRRCSKGELNPSATLTEEIARDIRNDLLYTTLSFKEIAKKNHVPFYTVSHINYGKSFVQDEYIYPLRSYKYKKDKTEILNIISDLKNEDISLEDICNKYQIERYVLLSINKGQTFRIPEVEYPIREVFLKKEKRDQIIQLLKSTNMTGKEIAKYVGVNLHAVYNINSGKTWHDSKISYPIRKLDSVIATSNERS